MTAEEKERMLAVVRWVERLFRENASLKVVLESHHVSSQTYERECEELMASKRVSDYVHAKFSNLYAEIESSPDLSKVLEAIARGVPMPDKPKMN
jgi:hypothetical protein